MNEKRNHHRIVRWAVVAAAVAVVLLGLGLAARPLLADQRAQARVLVEQGQRALGQGDRGAGVLALERARWLAPRAPFVRTALAAADVRDPESALPRALRLVTSEEWSLITIALGWTSGLALALAIAERRTRAAAKVAFAAAVGFGVSMVALFAATDTAPGVVTTPATRALVAPYAEAAASGPLPAGSVVVRGPEHNGFVRVRSGDGVEGWIPRDGVQPIARVES